MAEFPAMPLWTDAYLSDTTHLTTIQHGAFLLLLVTAWRAKTHTLPDDDTILSRYARLTLGQWKRIRPTIAAFWRVENGEWSNDRLLDEIEAVRRLTQQRSDAGRSSALKRLHRGSTSVQRKSNEISTPTPTPTPTPIEETSSLRSDVVLADEITQAVVAYNAVASDLEWPQTQRITPKRRAALKARIQEAGGLEGWCVAMDRARASPFLSGETGRGSGHENWTPDLDFFLQQSSFTKLMEGKYDRRSNGNGGAPGGLLAGAAMLIDDIRTGRWDGGVGGKSDGNSH